MNRRELMLGAVALPVVAAIAAKQATNAVPAPPLRIPASASVFGLYDIRTDSIVAVPYSRLPRDSRGQFQRGLPVYAFDPVTQSWAPYHRSNA